MRITMNTIFEQINTDLGRLTEKMAKTNSSISSGKIYRRPSDEPVALTHALGLRGSVADSEQCRRNILYAQGWVRATETAVTQLEDRLVRAKELAVQGGNDSQTPQSRQAIAAEVKTILEEVVALGNTKLGDRYVFAGTRTRGYGSGEAPFRLLPDGSVRYSGNTEDLTVDVASGLKQKINLDGETALVQSGVFEALDLLHDSLMADSRGGIESAIADLDTAIGYVNHQLAQLGAQANTLDNKDEMAEALILNGKERLSDIEETDMIKAITDLQTLETSYQASLASAAKITGLSLVDYIR